MQTYALLLIILGLVACHEDAAPDNPYHTEHFTVYYRASESSAIVAMMREAEHPYDRILSDLGVDSMPLVTVRFYDSFQEMQDSVEDVVPNLPVWAIGLATSEDRIHLLSAAASGRSTARLASDVVHEFSHCVSMHIKPNIANNPRWLWETVAVFESGQFVDPASLSYLVENSPPSLSELNSFNNGKIYEVGYVIGEYITTQWSQQHLRNLVLSNGNIQGTLGIPAGTFELGWYQFAAQKYLQ